MAGSMAKSKKPVDRIGGSGRRGHNNTSSEGKRYISHLPDTFPDRGTVERGGGGVDPLRAQHFP